MYFAYDGTGNTRRSSPGSISLVACTAVAHSSTARSVAGSVAIVQNFIMVCLLTPSFSYNSSNGGGGGDGVGGGGGVCSLSTETF